MGIAASFFLLFNMLRGPDAAAETHPMLQSNRLVFITGRNDRSPYG